MRASNLPSLRGQISSGAQLRIEIAKALSSIEVRAKRTDVLPPAVAALQTFLDAADTQLVAIRAYPASIVASAADVAMSLGTDATEQIVVTKTPLSGATSDVAASSFTTYTSSDVTKGTVNATGLVTAVAIGSFTVTAKHHNKTSNALAFTVAA